MKICVIIPAYNEAEAIAEIIRQIKQQDLDVVVIDDGSSDNTSQIARDNGATVLRNQKNKGKGASLIKGFAYVLDRDFDSAIVMDGDGQHLPEDISFFTRLAKYSNSGILIGQRMYKIQNMPWLRLMTNKFMSWIISFVARQSIPDTQCGFRLIKREVLEKLDLRTYNYETESEILIQASRLGFKIESVPIKTIYNCRKSRINPFIDTIRFIRFMAGEVLTK